MITPIALTLAVLAAAAADPTAVTVTPATTDRVVNWAIQAPLTVAFFLLLGAVGYLGRWLVTKAWPEWRDEQEKSRQLRVDENEKTRLHLEQVLDKRGTEATKDVADAHAAIGSRVAEVRDDVAAVSGKVDKVHEKISGVHALVRAMATKQGIGVLALFALCGYGLIAVGHRLVTSASYTCNPSCAAPAWCCKTDVCCRNASATACTPIPHSDRVVAVDYGDEPWSEIDALRSTSL